MLKRFEVSGVRNLVDTSLEFDPSLNLIVGRNASGKTSLLEAISILGTGKSFRASALSRVASHDRDGLRVFGECASGDRLGIQTIKGAREIRVNGVSVNRSSSLAQKLPLQSFTPDTHLDFSRNRGVRIAVLDWVLFHVEHGFHDLWSRYQRVLAQRNAALKKNQSPTTWNTELVRLGRLLISQRESALEWLNPYVESLGHAIPGTGDIQLRLKKGWALEKSLAGALEDDLERDRRDGFTHSGAHRADLDVLFGGYKARDEASQGQMKTMVLVLRLAQLGLFGDRLGARCLFLLDDLPAELDIDRRREVMTILAKTPLQVFISATEEGLLDMGAWPNSYRMFHVEHGKISASD